MIGTSTNIIASGIAVESGLKPFGMFEISLLGLVFVAVTITYMMLFGRRLLPDRVTLSTLFEAEEGKEFLTQAFISEGSPLVGKVFPDTPLAKMKDLRIIEVVRGTRRLNRSLKELEFEEGDQLLFKTRAGGIVGISETEGIEAGMSRTGELGLESVTTESAVLMEGIIGPDSNLVGKSLKELRFRQRYGVIILAVHRRGVNLRERFEDVKLAFGDTLFVEGPVEKMNRLFAERDFINLSRPKQRPYRHSKAPIAVGALALFLLLGSVTNLSIAVLAMSAALLVLLTRCIEPGEAYEAVDWKIIFMIFGMLGIGKAMEATGAASALANSIVGLFQNLGDATPYLTLAAIYLLAALLTEVISNNAVAALMTPLAIGIGMSLGLDPRPFIVAVMFGSSASFSTPIGYQTNTFVYGAGGYKFGDFARAGIPLAVLLWILASWLIPIMWGFHPA